MSKQETFTVMYDKGEVVNGVNIRPFKTFKSVMTPDLQNKVDKGWLVKGTVKEEKLKAVRRSSSKKVSKKK